MQITDELVGSAKNWLRISTESRNDEIRQVLAACLIDLSNSGVKKLDTEDAIIQQAMKLYLKAQFGYDSNADRFAQAYEHLKISLSLNGEYVGETSGQI